MVFKTETGQDWSKVVETETFSRVSLIPARLNLSLAQLCPSLLYILKDSLSNIPSIFQKAPPKKIKNKQKKTTLMILTNGHERGVDLEKMIALVVLVLPSTTLPPLPRVK